MLGGSPMRKKNVPDDRRKSSLNVQGMKNKLADNNRKTMAKRSSILNPLDGGFL